MTSLIRILLVLMVLIGSVPTVIGRAQDAIAHAAPAPTTGLAVAENDALVEFPDEITFSFDAETTDPIADLEFLYTVPGLDTLSVELPSFEPGTTQIALEHTVNFLYQQVPPGIDILYRWRITESDGDTIETPEQSVPWVDDRFDWAPLIGPNVTVYTYDADSDFQQAILDTAERTILKLTEAYDVKLEERVRIWAYANRSDYSDTLPPNYVHWSAGYNRPDLHLIGLVLSPGDENEVIRVVPHEISHQILYQATINPFNFLDGLPNWLDEGLAVYSQESGRDSLYTHSLQLAATGAVPPLRTLNGDFGYEGADAMAGYAFSLTAVSYILDTWGDKGMSRLIKTFREGVTFDDAIEQGLGITFDELDRRWREDLIADAQQAGATGTTRFGDDGGASPWATLGDGLALASGAVILGLVVLFALIAGLFSLVRSRRRSDDDEPIGEGVHWGEWPEGLELPRVLREP